jgi:DNA-binding XRE family transcriptional regulator
MNKNLRGENHPNWQMERPKIKYCIQCGSVFFQGKTEAISSFRKRKFCSKGCADVGGFRYEGEAHPNYKGASRRKVARGKHGAWARAVISRDKAICQKCGAINVELHAHHIEQFAEHPEKRWQISNGITLCYRCHWQIHELRIQNDDTLDQNHVIPHESYKKGKQSRRWEGFCEWCGTFVSKVWSQRKNRAHHFCSKSCAQKYRTRHLSDETRQKMSIAQKNAALKFKSDRIKSHSRSGTFLQNLRIEKGISQRELAGLIGISQGHLSELENGKYKISENIAVKLSSILKTGAL